jgi:hypothetical protein
MRLGSFVRAGSWGSLLTSALGLALAASAVATAGGCSDPAPADGSGDSYVDADLPDAAKNPGFRDGGDCPSGGSGGSSGSGSGACCPSGSGGSGGSGSCGPSDPTPDAAPACGEHTFMYTNATAQTVLVTGSFTNWASAPPGALAMTSAGAGAFTLTKQLGPGKFSYKFIVDGVWLADPQNPSQENDGFGGQNSVIVLCGGP